MNLIGRYRKELMGVAILWIMLFHSHIEFSNSILYTIKRLGYGGVDIFMFLSGFGIYYSLLVKKESLKPYLKKRMLRILPYYVPIVLFISIFYYVNNYWNLKVCILNITTFGFWFGYGFNDIFDWYIPSILFLYLISPIYASLFKLNKTIVTIFSLFFLYTISVLLLGSKFSYLIIFISRIPLYIMGFWLADYCQNNKEAKLSITGIAIAIISYIIGFSLLVYILYNPDFWMRKDIIRFPFALITIPLCFGLSSLFALFKGNKSFSKYFVLSFFGTFTLSLFIFHERVMWVFNHYDLTRKDSIIFIVAVVLAVSWQNLVGFIVKKIA